ncbi:unnamed protein product [Aphis gossypii]|uniref:Uncharacterized protein n=1 Tax=Aphis gossypii TaxID=80765 RepID=A0A9P0NJE2_APHGO|nr:unnamed protein product [Aphis gossypii]
MSDFKIQSPSSAASSMPNIAVMSGANGDVLEIQPLTSASMQQTPDGPVIPEVVRDEFAGPPKKLWCSMPNIHLELDANIATKSECIPTMQVLTSAENGSIKPTLDDLITDLSTVADELTAEISGANEILEIQSSNSAPMQTISGEPVVPEMAMAREEFTGPPKKMWCSMPNIHLDFDTNNRNKTSDGPIVPEVAREKFAGPPKKLWCSMPNIHLELDATNTNESKCIPVMQVLANAENGSIKMTLDDPIIDLGTVADDELTATSVEKGPRRRRSLWKRTKKIVRRIFCCA